MNIINAVIFMLRVITVLALLIGGLFLGAKSNPLLCIFAFLAFCFFMGELGYLCHRSETIQLNKDFVFFMIVALLFGEIVGCCRKVIRR